MLSTIFLVFAFVLAVLAVFNIGQPRWSLGWASLACYSLACYFMSLLLGASILASHLR
jgi:hypothetical protein